LFSGVRGVYRKIQGRGGGGADVHPHDADEPMHLHEPDGDRLAVAVAEDVPVSQWHHGHHGRPGHHHHKHPEPDAFMNYGARTAFVVGMLHGVGAETPTQVLIFATAVGAGGKAAGEAVLVTFLIGLLVSNSVITLGSAFGFLRASKNWTVYVTIAVLTGVFSLVVGTLLLLGEETVLPALFGG